MATKPNYTRTVPLIDKALNVIKTLRKTRVLQYESRALVLRCFFTLARKARSSALTEPLKVKEKVSELLGIGHCTVSKIVQAFTDDLHKSELDESHISNFIPVPSTTGNRSSKEWRIPDTNANYVLIRDYVRNSRQKKLRVTSTQILDFLISEKVLELPLCDDEDMNKKQRRSALRATQRWLKHKSFRRGKRTGYVSQKLEHIAMRHFFLRCIKDNFSKPSHEQKRLVFTDESYLHHHYNRYEESVYDPNDEQDEQVRMQHKGKRFCFVSAIQSANPVSPQTDPASIVSDSTWVFCPQGGADTHRGDYHKHFNASNYIKWWKTQLIPNLNRPSLILIDNAKYHKCRSQDTPKPHKMRKADIQNELQRLGVAYDEQATVKELRVILKNWINQNIKLEVCQIAEEKGHTVVFTPPHHSDFQPIELIWAIIKGNVGRQYDMNTTFAIVKERLDAEFCKLQTDQGKTSIEKCIKKALKIIESFYDELEDEEGTEGNVSDYSDSDSEVGSDVNDYL